MYYISTSTCYVYSVKLVCIIVLYNIALLCTSTALMTVV